MGSTALGVLAFGDSITNGGGELQWGVALQSWALWVARATGLPYSAYAVDGAQAHDVLAEQIPAFVQRATPGARYDLGCLYIGVNDVRSLDWDPERFERDYREALAFVVGRCDRVMTATAPLDLGRPRAAAKVPELNAIVVSVAASVGALVVDLSDFGARNQVMADRVHPTSFGQIAIAQRALRVLAADGMTVQVDPASLIRYETTWCERLRTDARYAYRATKTAISSAWIKARA